MLTVPKSTWVAMGATLAGLAVVFGAFAAHGLKGMVTQVQLSAFTTAVTYQWYHALALLLLGALGSGRDSAYVLVAGAAWMVGVLLFSGSLYLMVLTELALLGPLTPIGGVLLIIGWLSLAIGSWRKSL